MPCLMWQVLDIFVLILGDISLVVFRMCQTYGHHGLDEFRKEVHPHRSTPL